MMRLPGDVAPFVRRLLPPGVDLTNFLRRRVRRAFGDVKERAIVLVGCLASADFECECFMAEDAQPQSKEQLRSGRRSRAAWLEPVSGKCGDIRRRADGRTLRGLRDLRGAGASGARLGRSEAGKRLNGKVWCRGAAGADLRALFSRPGVVTQ
jgi:hypothetical protein